jgi:hypothetical protein
LSSGYNPPPSLSRFQRGANGDLSVAAWLPRRGTQDAWWTDATIRRLHFISRGEDVHHPIPPDSWLSWVLCVGTFPFDRLATASFSSHVVGGWCVDSHLYWRRDRLYP